MELLQESPAPEKILKYLTQGKLDAFYVGQEDTTLLHHAAIVRIECDSLVPGFPSCIISMHMTFGAVKGHTHTYWAKGGRAWELVIYVYSDTQCQSL